MCQQALGPVALHPPNCGLISWPSFWKMGVKQPLEKLDRDLLLSRAQDINFTEIRRDMTEKHRGETSKLEMDYQAQIQASEEQITKLKRDLDSQKKDFQNQLNGKDTAMEKAKKEMEENFQEALAVEKEMNESLRHEQKDLTREHEEIRKQLEIDTDIEIEEIKEKYENRLQNERDSFLRLKGENGIMRKKFNTLQKDIHDKNEEINGLFGTQSELDQKIKGLEKDIEALKVCCMSFGWSLLFLWLCCCFM